MATELDEDRKPTIHTGGNVLIKDATILTVTKGTIAKGSILVENGKIKAVGNGSDGARGRARSSTRPAWWRCPGSSTPTRTSPSRGASTR